MRYEKTWERDATGRGEMIFKREDGSIVDEDDPDYWDALGYDPIREAIKQAVEASTFEEEFNGFVGRMVKSARIRARLGQGELAAMLGVDAATISRIEHGRRPLRVSELVKVSVATNMEAGYFFVPPDPRRLVRTGWEPPARAQA
jgi:DNA-binding XRE family transcriptional regulator